MKATGLRVRASSARSDARALLDLQALTNRVTNPARVKNVETVCGALEAWELQLKELDLRQRKPVEEHYKVCGLLNLVPPDYHAVIVRNGLSKDQKSMGPQPMQLSRFENQEVQDWGPEYYQEWTPDGEDIPIDYFAMGEGEGEAKGKGKGGKGAKGKGEGDVVQGEAAQFDGDCGYCWKYGHKRADCRQRIPDMGEGPKPLGCGQR
jgi:hypothetical protein